MPAYPAELPPDGLNVNVALDNGVTLVARYEQGEWWAGLNDDPNDVPIANEHIVSWALIE